MTTKVIQFSVVIAVLVIAMMTVAGCTSSEAQKSEVVVSPTVVPTVVEDIATVATETVAPVVEPTVSAPSGNTRIVISIPAISQGATLRTRVAEVTIDGVKVGKLTSAGPLEVRTTEGPHTVGIQGFRDTFVDVKFGKTTSVRPLAYEATSVIEDNAQTVASKSTSIDSTTDSSMLKFTGTGDNVHMMRLKEGGVHFVGAVANCGNTKYGSGNFMVKVESMTGKTTYLFNEIPDPIYSGQKTATLPAGGYVVSVEGACSYTLLFTD